MLLFARERFGELPKDNSLFAGVSTSSRTMGFFPLSRVVGCLVDCYLARLFYQDHTFFLPGPAKDHFHAADVQCDPVSPSPALLTPPVSSPCLDANERIDLQTIRPLGCLTLQLCQTNQMWKGEPSELLVAKGYWKAVGAKFL